MIDMCLCNPAVKQPVASLMQPYRIHPIRQIPKSRSHILSETGTDPTNRAEPDPQMILFRTRFKYTSTVLNCQYIRKRLTVPAVSTLPRQIYSTGKQCRLIIVCSRLPSRPLRCKLASRVRTAIFQNSRAVSGWMVTTWQAVFRSGPARFSAQARWEHIPNPEIALRASCAFLQNAYLFLQYKHVITESAFSVILRNCLYCLTSKNRKKSLMLQ